MHKPNEPWGSPLPVEIEMLNLNWHWDTSVPFASLTRAQAGQVLKAVELPMAALPRPGCAVSLDSGLRLVAQGGHDLAYYIGESPWGKEPYVLTKLH